MNSSNPFEQRTAPRWITLLERHGPTLGGLVIIALLVLGSALGHHGKQGGGTGKHAQETITRATSA